MRKEKEQDPEEIKSYRKELAEGYESTRNYLKIKDLMERASNAHYFETSLAEKIDRVNGILEYDQTDNIFVNMGQDAKNDTKKHQLFPSVSVYFAEVGQVFCDLYYIINREHPVYTEINQTEIDLKNQLSVLQKEFFRIYFSQQDVEKKINRALEIEKTKYQQSNENRSQ